MADTASTRIFHSMTTTTTSASASASVNNSSRRRSSGMHANGSASAWGSAATVGLLVALQGLCQLGLGAGNAALVCLAGGLVLALTLADVAETVQLACRRETAVAAAVLAAELLLLAAALQTLPIAAVAAVLLTAAHTPSLGESIRSLLSDEAASSSSSPSPRSSHHTVQATRAARTASIARMALGLPLLLAVFAAIANAVFAGTSITALLGALAATVAAAALASTRSSMLAADRASGLACDSVHLYVAQSIVGCVLLGALLTAAQELGCPLWLGSGAPLSFTLLFASAAAAAASAALHTTPATSTSAAPQLHEHDDESNTVEQADEAEATALLPPVVCVMAASLWDVWTLKAAAACQAAAGAACSAKLLADLPLWQAAICAVAALWCASRLRASTSTNSTSRPRSLASLILLPLLRPLSHSATTTTTSSNSGSFTPSRRLLGWATVLLVLLSSSAHFGPCARSAISAVVAGSAKSAMQSRHLLDVPDVQLTRKLVEMANIAGSVSAALAQRKQVCEQTLPVFHWNSMASWHTRNFGDDMNVDVVSWVLNTTPEKLSSTTKRDDQKLVAIGSVLHFAKAGDLIWGTGIHEKGLGAVNWKSLQETQIYAMRGPRSKAQVFKRNVDVVSVTTFGDPGLLAPLVWPSILREALAKNNGNPQYDRCFVPHHSDEAAFAEGGPRHPLLEELHLHVVTTADTAIGTSTNLAQCKHVISTSLHGIIISHALGVPATWLHDVRSSSKAEGFLKYNDYLLSVGLEPFHYASSIYEAATGRYAQLPEPKAVKQVWMRLLNVFPYERVCKNGVEMRSELNTALMSVSK